MEEGLYLPKELAEEFSQTFAIDLTLVQKDVGPEWRRRLEKLRGESDPLHFLKLLNEISQYVFSRASISRKGACIVAAIKGVTKGGSFQTQLSKHLESKLQCEKKPHIVLSQFIVYLRLVLHSGKNETLDWHSGKVVVSHRCHNGDNGCITPSHIHLLDRGMNKKLSSQHCSIFKCKNCDVRMTACTHEPSCIRVVETVCSKCQNK